MRSYSAACQGINLTGSHLGIFGSSGNDTIIGTSESDYILPGEGADTVDSSGGMLDEIDLRETTAAKDIVNVVSKDDESNSKFRNEDYVYSFDTLSQTSSNHDALGFAIVQIAADTGTTTDGVDSGSISKHSIKNGIVTFYDDSNNQLIINNANQSDALNYLQNNLGEGDIVGFNFHTGNNGGADDLVVCQVSHDDSYVIELDGLAGNTLGTTAGNNVVQIVDTACHGPNSAHFTNGDLVVGFSENISSSNLGGNVTMYENGTTTETSGNDAISINGQTITIDTDSISASDYLLIQRKSGVQGDIGFKDASGNMWSLLDGKTDGLVLANTNTKK